MINSLCFQQFISNLRKYSLIVDSDIIIQQYHVTFSCQELMIEYTARMSNRYQEINHPLNARFTLSFAVFTFNLFHFHSLIHIVSLLFFSRRIETRWIQWCWNNRSSSSSSKSKYGYRETFFAPHPIVLYVLRWRLIYLSERETSFSIVINFDQ